MRSYFRKPDGSLNGLDLAEKRTDATKLEMTPVLKKSCCFWRYLPQVRTSKLAPLVHVGAVRSDGADGIACWFIDTDYNEESFFVRHAYFLGANDPYTALKTTLKAEINAEAWASLHSDTSRPFEKPTRGRIAVKVINHLGDEVMKVFKV